MSLLRPVAISLLGLSAGLAQNEATPPPLITPSAPGAPVPAPPVPGIPANPPAAPGAPAAGNVAIPLAEQKITQPIIFPKITGVDLAGLYRQYTGRRVIITSAASLAEFSFVQDASPTDPLTNAQAAELLKKAAALENFVFVRDGTDPNLDVLTFSAGGINPRGVGVDVLTESDQLPEGGEVVSYVMNLKYLKPDEAVRTFTAVIGQFGSYGSITPVANASSVIITENASLIRRLIQLKDEIDKPSSQVGTRFIKVEYADVTELATTLNELLNAQQTAQRTAGVQRTGNNAAPAPVPGAAPVVDGGGGEGGGSGEETPPQIVADPRTNRIFAMGRPVDLVFIEGLVAQFDTQSDSRNSVRRRLSYLSAVDFLPIAEQALLRAFTSAGAGSGGAAPAGGAGAAGGGNRGGASNAGGAMARNTGSGTSSSQFGSGGTSGNMRSSGTGTTRGTTTSGLADPDNNVAPQPLLVGRTLLVADTITNSVVVQGPPASVEIINKLLDEIDVKAEQVMISCVFGQLRLVKDFQFGIDYLRLLNNDVAGRGGAGFFPALPVNGNSFDPGSIGDTGLGVYGRIGDWRFMLNALDSSNNFEVISRPTVFMANNQKGTISSGTQIAVPTSSFAATQGNQSSTNFEFRDVALTLEVIPLVNSPTEITLKIFLVSQDIGDPRDVGADLEIPDIFSRELLTTVTVPNNETIVLGGLVTTRNTKGKSGIPILSQIPYVGGLFGNTTTNKERDELLIFIQPSIVADRPSLDAAQVDMDSRYDLTPNIRKLADGPGVLPPPDLVPLNEKGANKKKAIVVDPAVSAPKTYPHGTRFRSSPR